MSLRPGSRTVPIFLQVCLLKKIHLTAILQIQETKEKATGQFLTLLTWTSRPETGDFFSGHTEKKPLVRFQLHHCLVWLVDCVSELARSRLHSKSAGIMAVLEKLDS